MKKLLFFIFVLCAVVQLRASDTLTVRQVFNFSVGDTFDYRYTYNYTSGSPTYSNIVSQTYARFVIAGRVVSANNDSITYLRRQIFPSNLIDTIIYTHLDSSIFEMFDTAGVSQYLQFDTAHLGDGRLTNALVEHIPEPIGHDKTFGEGLGVTFARFHAGDDTYFTTEELDTTLIYYSKGSDTSGTPFYIYTDGEGTYLPIPEECAFWNYTSNSNPGLMYQIRTGNKVFLNGHTYVEVIMRSSLNGTLQGDSSIGFFRNDSIGHKLYFSHIPGNTESVLYDFTIGSSIYYVSHDYVGTMAGDFEMGGVLRRYWSTFHAGYPFPNSSNSVVVIGGIGSVTCLFQSGDFSDCGLHLTSFCVCGQTLYPDTATGQCELLGIPGIAYNNSKVSAYPNPTNEAFHLSIMDASISKSRFIITDLLGKEILSQNITSEESDLTITSLTSGMYEWQLVSGGQLIKTGKFVKE